MSNAYFSKLFPHLSESSKRATLGRVGFANTALRKYLADVFSSAYGAPGNFVGDPTFEAMFGWQACDQSMKDLSGQLLSEPLVKAMDSPPAELADDYRFAIDQRPYRHQLEAWRLLSEPEPQSVVVASGTGSGKTECFMVPILDRLAREREETSGPLVGVRALFLYPLNALINSQRDRLRAWTDDFDGDIRFSLYNGNTPREVPSSDHAKHPNEVLDRKRLWASPPPILVTNATMLEYMLVRTQDAPILNASNGKLEWIVLDEAHTYIGSQAAEVALLIRRVLHAFGVAPDDVRFVATSATIGDPNGEAGLKLRAFLAQVAGVVPSRVHLVAGERQIPTLTSKDSVDLPYSELVQIESDQESSQARYDALIASPLASRIRQLFVSNLNKPVARLSEVTRLLPNSSRKDDDSPLQSIALKWLDLLTGTRSADGTSFLPLRAHVFHQTLSGLWACADPDCSVQHDALKDKEIWPFGHVYLEPRQHCQCGSPVYEVVACDSCRTVHLMASIRNDQLLPPMTAEAIDEFELELETDADIAAQEDDDTDQKEMTEGSSSRVLVVNRQAKDAELVGVDRRSRGLMSKPDELHDLRLWLFEEGKEGLACPSCHEVEKPKRNLFQTARIGAPFLLVNILPLLLEYAPDGSTPAAHPYRGRRLLTFNDSRQGTARIAARLQQESERSRIRGLIYHQSLVDGRQQADQDSHEREEKIHTYETAMAATNEAHTRKIFEELLKPLYEQREASQQPKAINFIDLARHLTHQGSDFDLMLKQYRKFSAQTFGSPQGALELAQMFLIREFGRRPKRQNNLETMGLVAVQYPELRKVDTAPSEWIAAGFSVEDWRSFLKIILDYFVRANGAINIPDEWRNWLGMPFAKSWLVDRDERSTAPRQKRWPRAKRRPMSTVVKLLAYVLGTDPESAQGQDRIDAFLLSAWSTLTNTKLLTRTAGGFILDFKEMAFTPPSKVWICPVTRRFLDTTLKGVTPYLPKNASETKAVCQEFQLPLYEHPFGGMVTDAVQQAADARAWIDAQEAIAFARQEGLWTGLNDRVIELSPYFVSAEHSAQQESAQLDAYEKAFKQGDVNLLSCSTTMEMGIDIGGISVVAMNNVPPHPANYLQRAGRAGRRRESRSLSVTLCKSNPHDQSVFFNSRWAFDTPLPAPLVSLNSAVIVQRHVNALALSSFLAGIDGRDLTKLSCEWFFTGTPNPSERFMSWCLGFDSEELPSLAEGLQHLVKHSVYEGFAGSLLLQYARAAIEEVCTDWSTEWNALLRQSEETRQDGAENPAHKAVQFQIKRVGGEYLLRELATRGFLPGYGFPAHITSFENLTLGKYVQAQKRKPEREDNRYRRRELPSRDRVTALREYAPGSEIVIDGLMYRSDGITLNWHIPATARASNEVQEFRFAWRCHHCGASGSTHSLKESQTCKHCGHDIKVEQIKRFLEPAGFAVDFYKEPTNDVTTQHFVSVEPPWITASGEWQPLVNPELGRYRTTASGHIFHHSSGIYRHGYAICLACGRAAPMQSPGDLPPEFMRPHTKLRGNRKDSKFCSGSEQPWSIQRSIVLGHEAHTDVLEIQLKDEMGLWLNDFTTARTLSIALRDSLANLLGVQAQELACDIKESVPQEGEICQSIFIYDKTAAGYASSSARFVNEMFLLARSMLLCRADCDSACPQCILDFDQRFAFDSINRHEALKFLTESWLNQLKLPSELMFFGVASRSEYCGLSEAILRESSQRDTKEVCLYFSANSADFGPSPLRRLAYRLAGAETRVNLVLASDDLVYLEEHDKHFLASLADHPNMFVYAARALPSVLNGYLLADLAASNLLIRWASADATALVGDHQWGVPQSALVVGNMHMETPRRDWTRLTADELRPMNVVQGDVELVVQQQLDGQLQGFGKALWSLLVDEHYATAEILRDGTDEITEVTYCDRYLWTPLAAALVVNVVESLRNQVGSERWGRVKVGVWTSHEHFLKGSGYPNMVWHDWQDDRDRDDAMREAFEYVGMEAHIQSDSKSALPHGRSFEVRFRSGRTLTVRFDQGIAYWKVPQLPFSKRSLGNFSFNADARSQGATIANMRIPVVGSDHPTELFAKVRK